MDKIIFLDRDGVINVEPGADLYVIKWKQFKFLPGSIEAIKKLNKAGYKLFVISNQAGVSKGLFSQKNLDDITKNMLSQIQKADARIDGVFYCPHKTEDNCDCKKPKVGLIKKAVKDKVFDAKKSFFIGDAERDIIAGKAVGVNTILVLTGKSQINDSENWPIKPDLIKKDLSEAAAWIIEKYS